MITRILVGLLLIGVGGFLVIRTRVMLDFFGHIDWAERKLGGGGSALLYKVIGIIVCFTGMLVATNMWNAFLEATLGSFLIKN